MDDQVIVGGLIEHQPYSNAHPALVKAFSDTFIKCIENRLATQNPPQNYKKQIRKYFSKDVVDLSVPEQQAGYTSTVYASISELMRMHKAFIKPLNLPIEAECAWFFLLLRMQHFKTKINAKSAWLNMEDNGKSVTREAIEDLYK